MIDLQPNYNITTLLPSSPVDGQIWDDLNTRFSWKYSTSTGLWSVVPTYGIGGDLVQDIVVLGQAYRVHSFTDTTRTQGFSVSSSVSVQYLVVGGGGGGGGGCQGGGGGAGGLLTGTVSISAATYTIIVGTGGLGCLPASSFAGSNGNNSIFSSLTAIGGGRGASQGPNTSASLGGSGGGANGDGGGYTPGAGTSGQGNAGGGALGFSTVPQTNIGGGGGGASSVGTTATSGVNQPAGGLGASSDITGQVITYATGGAGASRANITGAAGAANTGNGGGAGGNNTCNATGGNGGSGIVIVRYAI
jgi:hypothetical protein